MRDIKRFFSISFLISLLLTTFVAASLTSTVNSIWANVLHISSLSFLGTGTGDLEGLLRLVVGILVFTILYAASVLIADFTTRNIRIALAVVLSVLSMVLMPGTVLVAIAGSFSGFFGFIFLTLPHVGILWGFFKTKTDSNGTSAIKFAAALLGVFLSANIAQYAGTISSLSGSGAAAGVTIPIIGGTFGTILNFFGYLTFGYIIMAIYFALKMMGVFSEPDNNVDSKKSRSKLKKWWDNFSSDENKAEKWELLVYTDLKKLLSEVSKVKDLKGYNRLKTPVNKEKRHERKAYQRINRLEADINKLPTGVKKNSLKKIFKDKIMVQNNFIIAKMRAFEALLSSVGYSAAKVNSLKDHCDKMIKAEEALQAAFRELKTKAEA